MTPVLRKQDSVSKDDILLKMLELHTNSDQSEYESPHIYSIPNTSVMKENLSSQNMCQRRGNLE